MFTPIIGLEIHLQLKTKSKVFCSCPNAEAEPNTNICPICLGYPGAMPNLNQEAVIQAIRMGISLNCEITGETKWDRKSYMYPDLFKGYQISQIRKPVCGEGSLEVLIRDRKNYYSKDNYSKKIGIIQAHLEEDTAKSIHGDSATLLDGNKAGVPLLEIVSAPDMHTVDEAVSYAKTIRNLARWFDICDGNLELGQMRFDANISICVEDVDILNKPFTEWKGVKHTPIVEIKNMNAFSNLQDALDFEIKRQIEEYKKNGETYSPGMKETRGWDDQKRVTLVQRKKEEANEYRFVPEPDIPVLEITNDDLQILRETTSKHPIEVKKELLEKNVAEQAANLIAEDIRYYGIYDGIISYSDGIGGLEGRVANLIVNELRSEIEELYNSPPSQEGNRIITGWTYDLSGVFESLFKGNISESQYKQIIRTHNRLQNDWSLLLSNSMTTNEVIDLETILQKAFQENPGVVEQIKSGKDSAKMFFVGLVMRETKGKANANDIKTTIDKLLQS